MFNYVITYYSGRTMTTIIQADNQTQAEQIARSEMKSVLHLILDGKYQVTRYWM